MSKRDRSTAEVDKQARATTKAAKMIAGLRSERDEGLTEIARLEAKVEALTISLKMMMDCTGKPPAIHFDSRREEAWKLATAALKPIEELSP